MTETSGADALLSFWKTQIEEATKAWTRAVNEAQGVDPARFWRPVMDPAIGAWAQLFARGPVSPELMGQWKQFLDQWIDAWGEALQRAMHTEAFAQAMGRYLDQWVSLQAPVRKAGAEMGEAFTATLGLASRADVALIRRQLTDLEDRIDDIHEQLRQALAADRTAGSRRPRTRAPRRKSSRPRGR